MHIGFLSLRNIENIHKYIKLVECISKIITKLNMKSLFYKSVIVSSEFKRELAAGCFDSNNHESIN